MQSSVYGQEPEFEHQMKGVPSMHSVSASLVWMRILDPCSESNQELNSFHHRCIRAILGISNKMQWTEHISSFEVR